MQHLKKKTYKYSLQVQDTRPIEPKKRRFKIQEIGCQLAHRTSTVCTTPFA
jgi:hypothetical protein